MQALIFIHGFSSNKEDFTIAYERLKDKYDFVSLTNLPGHEDTKLENFNAPDTIMYVKELCKEVFSKYDKVDIVGYSMGGALTSMLSLEFDFRKIVLVAPANKYNGLGNTYKKIPYFVKGLFSKEDEEAQYHHERIVNEDKHAIAMLSSYYKKYNAKSLSSFMQVIDYCNDKLNRSDKKLDDISIIYGRLDQVIPYTTVNFLNKHCDNIKYHEIEYANHFLLTSDYGDSIADLIEDSLFDLTLEKVMKFNKFCLIGDTNNPLKAANKIKNELIKNKYTVTEDVEEDFDVLNLCINPIDGLEILKDITKRIRVVLLQPGTESEEIIALLKRRNIAYLQGCSLKGLEIITK